MLAPVASLSNEEILRYSRHLIMPEVGVEGQRKLKAAKVLCIGTGGLGAPLCLYLTVAGVGHIGLVDFDVVDFTNLQRQVIFGTSDVGRPKTEGGLRAAEQSESRRANHHIRDETHKRKCSRTVQGLRRRCRWHRQLPDALPGNDTCVLLGKPNVYGSIFRFEGQVAVFGMPDGPCYRCLYPESSPPGLVPSCAEGGVLGVLPGIVRSLQALETIKLIIGRGESLAGRLVLFEALSLRFRELRLRKNQNCPMCGTHRKIHELIDYNEFCGIEEEPGSDLHVPEITARELKEKLDNGEDVFILDVREPHEYQICNLKGHLIPLGELPRRVHELDPAREIVAHCKSGFKRQNRESSRVQAAQKKMPVLIGSVERIGVQAAEFSGTRHVDGGRCGCSLQAGRDDSRESPRWPALGTCQFTLYLRPFVFATSLRSGPSQKGSTFEACLAIRAGDR